VYAKRLARVLGRGWLAFAGVMVAGLPAGATPLISEVYYDAVGADNGHGFVEIAGVPGADLAGYRLLGVNGANGAPGPLVELVGAIGPSGLFLLADVDREGVSATPGADQYANFDFQNGPDSVQLLAGSVVVDALAWGVFGPGEFPAGEGAPAPDAPPGSSLARLFADRDSDDNAADFGILAVPTPGQATFAPIPEPGSGALLTLALGFLAGSRRRTDAAGVARRCEVEEAHRIRM